MILLFMECTETLKMVQEFKENVITILLHAYFQPKIQKDKTTALPFPFNTTAWTFSPEPHLSGTCTEIQQRNFDASHFFNQRC